LQDFYEDIFEELAKFGEIENLNVCDNIADHMVGSVYVKFLDENAAAMALQGLTVRSLPPLPTSSSCWLLSCVEGTRHSGLPLPAACMFSGLSCRLQYCLFDILSPERLPAAGAADVSAVVSPKRPSA